MVLPDLRNGYVDLATYLLNEGYPVRSRGLDTLELTGVQLEFPDPTGVMLPVGVGRRVNSRLAAVEALQLISGTFDANLVRRAAPAYADVLVRPDDLAYGAYGPRLREQLDEVTSLLTGNPRTRRAVLSIWREDDLTHDGDRPCTLSLQFLLRYDQRLGDDALELIVTMRSQDLFLGVPYDLFMFSQLQASLAYHLGVGVGRYVHQVGSLHLYDRDREAIGMLTACPADRPPPLDYPRGVRSWNETSYPTETAARLLTRDLDDVERHDNAWYLRQLAQLGVGGLVEAELNR